MPPGCTDAARDARSPWSVSRRSSGTGSGSRGSSSVLTARQPARRASRVALGDEAADAGRRGRREQRSSFGAEPVRRGKESVEVLEVGQSEQGGGLMDDRDRPGGANGLEDSDAVEEIEDDGCAPRAVSRLAFSSERDVPITSWPRSSSWGTRREPRAPVAPATKTLMVFSFRSPERRRNAAAGCDGVTGRRPSPSSKAMESQEELRPTSSRSPTACSDRSRRPKMSSRRRTSATTRRRWRAGVAEGVSCDGDDAARDRRAALRACEA